MKKVLALMVLTAILLFLCCGCEKKPKKSVVININVPYLVMDCIAYPECGNTTQFLQAAWDGFAAQYEKYDVSLMGGKVHQFEQTEYTENIPDQYGTAEAVDLTFGGYFMLGNYIYDGHVIPLDDIITDKIYYDISGETWALSKGTNDKIYMLPFFSLQNILCYNIDLFEQCGVELNSDGEKAIRGWSLETWETVLSALAANLPDGSYPMMMYAKNDQGDTHTMIQLRCKGAEFFDENGQFNLDTPEGIAGLTWLKDNYDKGYYPEKCEDLEIMDCQKLFLDGRLAIFLYNSALSGFYEGMNIGFVNFPGADGRGVNSDWISGFMVFDNGDANKIEVIKDFLKYIYDSDSLMDYATGGNPCSKNVVERWHKYLPFDYEFIENTENTVDFMMNSPDWPEIREAFWPHIHALLAGTESAEEAAAGIDRDCNTVINSFERILHE